MKRLVYIIFVLTCSLISAQAQTSGSCGDNLTWQFADSTLTITGSGAMYDEAPWEHLKESIAQIRLPQGLTRVGDGAFGGCTHLRSVTIPSSVMIIGDLAFWYCPSLTSIVVESGNLVYDSRNNCNAIIETASGKLISGCSTTVIPQGVTSIEGLAFEGQAALTSITFPNSVLRIRGRAFCGCSSLNAITIPSSVQVIEDESFRGCLSLTSITVESGNNVYDSRNNCNAIIETATNRLIAGCQNTIIPNDVAIIAGSAFRNQLYLTSITIPESVTTIGDWSFAESGLTSIVIPNSVTNLGWAAFNDCSSLRSVVLPNSLDTMQAEMLSHCNIQSIFLPSSVKHIKHWGFWTTPLSQIYLTSPTPVTLETEEVFSSEILTCYIPTGTLQAYQSMPMWQNQRSLINFVEKDFSNKCGDNLYWTLQDSTLTIIGAGAMYDYSSYSSVPWYSSRSSIAHVSLPEGLTHIGQYAFYNHPKLNSITIPNSVTSIGNYAFYNCDGLTQVTIPNSVTSIGIYAFKDCDGLTQVTIPNSVTSIGDEAFCDCDGLTQVTIPNSVTSIGNYAFYGCDQLVSVAIGSGITTIGTYAFWDCYKLKQIRIDAQTPPVVSNNAFPSAPICYVPVGCLEAYQAADWASMVSRFEESEQQIKCAEAATRCMTVPSVVHYTIYGYVTELTQSYSSTDNTLSFWVADMPIGGRVLHAHNVVPNATTDRTPQKGDYVKLQGYIMLHDAMPSTAEGCTMEILSAPISNLTAQCGDSLYWMLSDSTLTIAGSGMMYDYSSSAPTPWSELKNSFHTLVLPQGLTTIGDNAFADCAALQAVAIPTTVTNIGTAAFQNCTALTTVLIPEGVQHLEDNAFKGCSALATVYAQAITPPTLGNTIFNSKPLCYVPASTITSYQTSAWGNYVNTFEENNQKCGDNLYWLYIDSTLTIVGTGEMTYSTRPWASGQIARAFLPEGLKSIAVEAFYGSKLTSITLPNSLTSIKASAFYGSTLTSLVLPDSIISIGENAFYNSAIYNNTANWVDGVLYISDYLIKTNSNLPAAYTIKEGTRLIADYAFSGSSIASVTMPESVVSVGDYAFNSCTSLQSIRLANNITSLGTYAFSGCSSLPTIHIPGGVKSIGDYAFNACSKLAFVNLSEGIEKIGNYAFRNCTKLTQITIPSTITHIRSYAFYSCNALKAVYVAAATPPTLGSSAFNPSTTKCYLDCGLMTNYLASSAWCNMFGSFVEQCTQNIHTFDDAQKNAEWQFIQSGQTNQWVVGTEAGSASWRNQALYVSLDGNSFAYDHNAASTSWAYIPVTLTANDSISFAWRGEGEMCCDYVYAYLIPTNVLPSAGSTTLPDSAITLTAKLNQQAAWQHISVLPNVEGDYNLFFMWTNDESSGTTSFAIDDVCIKSADSLAANKCGDDLYWTLTDNTLTITGTGAMYEYAKIDMIPWYSQRTNIYTIVLPEGLTNISRNAFYGCTNLVSINIPSTLTSIASRAFYDCQYLRGPINIPEGSTMVGDSTFYNCRRLSAISIPNNIDSIGVRAFYNCDSLTQLTLPDSLVKIKAYAFYDCDYIKRVVIPNNVTKINGYAFYSCAGLTTVTIGSRVDSLGTNVFNSCSALDTLYVLNPTPPILASNALYSSPICYVPTGSLSAYQSSAWANYVSSFVEQGQCGDNLYFTITNGTLSIIGSGAMYDYTSSALAPWYSQLANIATINLPDGLTSIGAWAFYDCDSISSISIPSTVTTIGNEAFYHCSNLTSVSIPDAVTTLGYEALANCTLLTQVTLGSSVISIGGYAFSYCPALAKLTFKSVTPPTPGDYIFSNSSAPACYVPCGTLSAYQSSAWATLVASISEKCLDENYHDFETEQLNAQWQFAQSGQTNYWTIGTAAGSASTESSFAMYITNNGGYNYQTYYSSTSWAYLPITITATDSISFYWKGTGESSYDNLRVYLFPENTTPTAGSTSTVSGAQQLTSNYLSGQSTWQRFEVLPGVEGNYNLCFVWKNDGSGGGTPIAVDNIHIGNEAVVANNKCGDYLYWEYENGTLTITGRGAMYDYESANLVPWYGYRANITNVVLPAAITHIGNHAFEASAVATFNFEGVDVPLADGEDIVFFANTYNWETVYTYCWNSNTGATNSSWPGTLATKASFTYEGYDVYYYIAPQDMYPNCIFNSGAGGDQTVDLDWTSQHIYKNGTWHALSTNEVQLQTIGVNAFANCQLVTMTLPETLQSIYNGAFANNNLSTLYVEATTPPALADSVFTSQPTCYVPCGTFSAYQSSDWANFMGQIIDSCNTVQYTTNATICYGETYTWEVNGETYSSSGVYDYSEYNEAGELMHWVLNLTVSPAPVTEAETVVITENDLPYTWRGYSIAEAGTYTITEPSIHGCDSVIHELYLIVEANATVYNAYICYGETYTWEMNGTAYSESGIYTYSDSWTGETTAILNLTVSPAPVTEAETVVITENDLPYTWRGYSIAEAGTYTITEPSIHDCDSIIYELYLTVETSSAITNPVDNHNFEDASLNAQWHFIQNGQTNYWTIGTDAGSTSGGSNALYITNDGYNYGYTNSAVSVSWAYIPVELETSDTISFNWKGTAEGSYDNMRVYLYPTGTLPTAGSSTIANDAVQVTSTYLCGQSNWQTFTAVPGLEGTFNLCFMWKNDASAGSMPIAVDEVRIPQATAPILPENQCGDNLYWAYSNGTLTITGSGAMYDGNDLFTYRQQSWFPDEVTRVNLPDGMTHIGATAFADCRNLTSINIPSSVVSIGEAAFAWSGLQTLTLPEGVQDIYNMAFANCGHLTKFIYRGTPDELGNATTPMFLGCNQLDTIIAPARMWDCPEPDESVQEYYGLPSHIRYIEVTGGELSTTNISYMANSNRTLLTLDISSVSNNALPNQAFINWKALETLRLPANLTEIPYQMAYACENLKAIFIPSYVTVIGDEAFRGCSKLSSIDFADSQNLYSIGQYAFAYCSALLSVEVPVGVQTLGAYAFRNTGLVQLRLPSTLSVIGNYTFYNCSHLLKMNVAAYTPPTVSSYTFYNVPRTAKVYVPESVVNTYKSTAVWREFFIESNVQDAVDNILTEGEEQTQKLFINGQVIIIRNGKSYNLMGQEL